MDKGDPEPRTAPDPGPNAVPHPADPQALARDWITLWQSELAATAADRELREAWQTMAALWAGAAGAMLRPPFDGHAGRTRDGRADAQRPAGAAEPARPAPAAVAPDTRDAELDRLARRVADLERRLAELAGDA